VFSTQILTLETSSSAVTNCAFSTSVAQKRSAAFHAKQFAFLDPALETNPARLAATMESMAILLPTDTPAQRAHLMTLCKRSLELLSRPFRSPRFDFGDPAFMSAIYELGEENRKNDALRGIRGQRGSADTIYLNRTFFGLYSLLTRLRARVQAPIPTGLVFE